ncbi:hypothetical protein [Roseateles saccharophilus]|nr:hypothetical protein [Roseateles saccharophilus]
MSSSASLPAAARRDMLRDELLATVSLLKQRRAAEIAEGYVDDYIALHWMEWHGGSLRLTTTGENVCKHLKALLARAAGRSAV